MFFFIFQNLSQQSDISDLLGGFKPTDARSICFPLYIEFKDLFCRSFPAKVLLLLLSSLAYITVYMEVTYWVGLFALILIKSWLGLENEV